MCERCEELEGALLRIAQWAEAYPVGIFHEPTAEECKQAHKVLTEHGMTLDAFALKGVGDIAKAVLNKS